MVEEMTNIVYVVQKQLTQDGSGRLVPKVDLTPARQFGTLEYLLGPTAGPNDPESVLADLRVKLQYLTEEDFLLLVGNPCLIGWAVAVAAQRCPRLNLLQWSSRERKYYAVPCDLSEPVRIEINGNY